MKKSRKPHHPDDVSIGENEWIRFVDITGRSDRPASLDEHIQPMEPFWRALEVNCVSECCGINAHSLWPEDIWNAARSARDPQLLARLEALRQYTASVSSSVVHSTILNQLFDRDIFLSLLDHVIAKVDQMTPSGFR
jgi:hypothetical protein